MQRKKKIWIYKICCTVFAVVLLLLPQRGLPYSDIRVLATVLGIDGSAGNVTVAAQLAVPVAQNSDGDASTVAKASGGSLSEALENLEIGLGRRISYGHLSTVAIGQNMALTDMRDFVGQLMSSGKVGPGAYLVYSCHLPASEFIAQAQQLGESSDAELSTFISYNKTGNHVSTTSVLKFLQGLHSPSHAAFLPCVKLEDENGKDQGNTEGTAGGSSDQSGSQSDGQSDDKSEEQSAQSSGQSGDEEEEGTLKGGHEGDTQKRKLGAADTVAIIGGQSDKPLLLDPLTTRGIVWQDDTSDFGLVELRDVQLNGETVSSVSARLTGKQVKKRARVSEDENVLTYTVKVKLRLADTQIFSNLLFFKQQKKTLEKAFESLIENSLLRTVTASKETDIDFLGMRDVFYRQCRAGFDDFDLQKTVVKVDAHVTIQT